MSNNRFFRMPLSVPQDEDECELEREEDETDEEFYDRVQEWKQEQEDREAEYLIEQRLEREYD